MEEGGRWEQCGPSPLPLLTPSAATCERASCVASGRLLNLSGPSALSSVKWGIAVLPSQLNGTLDSNINLTLAKDGGTGFRQPTAAGGPVWRGWVGGEGCIRALQGGGTGPKTRQENDAVC